jgi:L-rhamnose mutarotase
MRQSFAMTLKPAALPEYKRRHEQPWSELLDAIGDAGVSGFSIFDAGHGTLFLYSEVDDATAWEHAWATPVHERWGEEMAPLIAVDERGAPRVATLPEIFHFSRAIQ